MTIKLNRRQAIIGAGAASATLAVPNVVMSAQAPIQVPEWLRKSESVCSGLRSGCVPNSSDSNDWNDEYVWEVMSINKSSNTWIGKAFGIETEFSLLNIYEWMPAYKADVSGMLKSCQEDGKKRGVKYHMTFNSTVKAVITIAGFLRLENAKPMVDVSIADDGRFHFKSEIVTIITPTVSEFLLPENADIVKAIDEFHLRRIEMKNNNEYSALHNIMDFFDGSNCSDDLTDALMRIESAAKDSRPLLFKKEQKAKQKAREANENKAG